MSCFNFWVGVCIKEEFTVCFIAAAASFQPKQDKSHLNFLPPPPVNATQSNEDALLMIKGCTYMYLLSLPSTPAFLDMHMVQSPVVFVLGRQQAGISQLTFRKCHIEGEKHSHPLCSSAKISQPQTEMLKQDFSSIRSVTYSALIGGRLARE